MIILPAVTREGRVRVECLRGGKVVQDTGFTPNLITDAGLAAMNGPGSVGVFGTLRVGSGTTPPQFSDTALVNQLASAAAGWGTTIVGGYAVSTTSVLFPMGAVVGNVGEVGFGSSPSSPLATRALIKDQNGDPVVVPVLADEQLRVTYEVRCLIPTTPTVTTQVIDGVSTTVTVTAARTDSAEQWHGIVSGSAANGWDTRVFPGSLYPTSSSPLTTSRGTRHTWGPNAGNAVGGITSIYAAWTSGNGQYGLGAWSIEFNPPLAKTNSKSLTLDLSVGTTR